jgi:S-DNA-T family DNA segregation ATPase FtsK/SpoIIIE
MLGAWVLVGTYGTDAAVLLAAVLVAVLAGVGRAARPPKSTEAVNAEAEADESAPFPLADAHTRAEAADATARALCAEGIELRMTGDVVRTWWGWEVSVMLRRGTPALVTAKTGELETHLDLPAGGVLVTPDRARRAHVMMRLAQRDPFAGQAPGPYRPPHSGTVTERVVIGDRIDGLPLEIPVLGVHGVIIGSPGAGKSTTLAALGEAITASTDGIVWDFDPAGLGLDVLGDAVGRRERDRAGIEDGLADALALAQARPRLLGDLGMGSAWVPSPQYPAVVVIVDEYPRLSDSAKELAVQLLRVGRKARVTLILAATEATSDVLGASIAELAALKVLHSCRSVDVRLVLGPNMAAEGWRPDRLHPATADDPGNVGQCYVSTARLREPLIAKVHPLDPDATTARAAERAEAGVPRVDAESWSAARTLRGAERSGGGVRGGDAATGVAGDAVADRVALTVAWAVLRVFGSDGRLWTEEILCRLAQADPDRYGQWRADDLADALRPLRLAPVQLWRSGANRRGYRRQQIADSLDHAPNPGGGDGDTPGTGGGPVDGGRR